jgi:methyl-accepting chemotaxis protein
MWMFKHMTFERIPKTTEDAELWAQMKAATIEWKKENDVFFQQAHDLEKLDILNPTALLRDLELFRGDHHELEGRAEMIRQALIRATEK